MNSLEALKRLDNDVKRGNCEYNITPYVNIIKQALERKEKLEKENQELKEQLKLSNESQETVINIMSLVSQENEKLKKAIEILKKFNFKLGQYGNGEYYILIYYAGITIEIILTQEEYDLLKEVLGQ